ncbi:MAG TPA: DUF2157 domain-containing protein [Armatimonadota bacterium]|jgi:uncharacterized membrane protein
MDDRKASESGEWLRHEAEEWTQEGLIRAEQARLILARYGLEGLETPRSLKRALFVQILTVLGAALAGVGVLLMVGANWEALPRVARIALILAASGGSYAGGWFLWRERGDHPAVGQALILLGSILWGAGIFLIGQMYQGGGAGDPNGERMALLYWFIGTLPLGILLKSPVQTALSIALGSIWWIWMWADSAGHYGYGQSVFVTIFALGLAVFAKGRLISGWEPLEALGPVCEKFGIAGCTLGAYALSFDLYWSHATGSWWKHPLLLLPVGAAIVFGAWVGWRDREDRGSAAAAWAAAILAALTLVAAWAVSTGAIDAGVTLRVVFNVLLLAMSIGLIWLGWESASPGFVNWGVAVFFIQLVTRYLDLFARLMPTGLAFLGAGALLIVGGLALERQRKQLLRSMEAKA